MTLAALGVDGHAEGSPAAVCSSAPVLVEWCPVLVSAGRRAASSANEHLIAREASCSSSQAYVGLRASPCEGYCAMRTSETARLTTRSLASCCAAGRARNTQLCSSEVAARDQPVCPGTQTAFRVGCCQPPCAGTARGLLPVPSCLLILLVGRQP